VVAGGWPLAGGLGAGNRFSCQQNAGETLKSCQRNAAKSRNLPAKRWKSASETLLWGAGKCWQLLAPVFSGVLAFGWRGVLAGGGRCAGNCWQLLAPVVGAIQFSENPGTLAGQSPKGESGVQFQPHGFLPFNQSAWVPAFGPPYRLIYGGHGGLVGPPRHLPCASLYAMLSGGENLRHKKGVGAGCGFPGLVPLSIIVIF